MFGGFKVDCSSLAYVMVNTGASSGGDRRGVAL